MTGRPINEKNWEEGVDEHRKEENKRREWVEVGGGFVGVGRQWICGVRSVKGGWRREKEIEMVVGAGLCLLRIHHMKKNKYSPIFHGKFDRILTERMSFESWGIVEAPS